MNLERTTIISPDNENALATLQSFLDKNNALVMVILGHTKTIEKSMRKADNLAKLSHFNVERWVVWLQDPELLKTEITKHLNASNADKADEAYDNIKCYCYSHITDSIDGIILKNGRLSTLTLSKSFMLAQLKDTDNSQDTNV